MMIPGEVRGCCRNCAKPPMTWSISRRPFVAHYQGIEIANLLDIPRMETYHTFFRGVPFPLRSGGSKGRVAGVVAALFRPSATRWTRWWCPRPRCATSCWSYGVRVPMRVVPTGIPPAQFAAGDGKAFRLAHGIPRERRVLLFVGRVAFEKNIDFLLRALERAIATIRTCCW